MDTARRISLHTFVACIAFAASSCSKTEPVAPLPGLYAFTGVTVIARHSERRLADQTVIVRDGRITTIGASASTPVPERAHVIDGRGRYLIPGLADMHVHLWNEGELTLFIANGVTTVRNMGGDLFHLAWREKIKRGEMFGPTIFTAGPVVDGASPVFSQSISQSSIATDDAAV